MCGIAGMIGEGSPDLIRRMTRKLTHRGPDAEGYFESPTSGVWLGHRRLSILDLAGGTQPMQTADGRLTIVFNGEIYNHAELRRELESQGHRFQTDHSDTEVLLEGYRAWGDRLVERLNGMWAFAIYDHSQQRLFCSRDRFGKKPFYYFNQRGNFAFASELSALLEIPDAPRSVDSLALRKFFAYCLVPAPLTLLAGIYKLPAGHSLLWEQGMASPRIWRYWEFALDPFTDIPADAEEVWSEEIRRLLKQAVQRRLVADVPVGIFLSGGIDSSAVAALAADLIGGEKLQTFSIGFEEASFDESAFARLMAERLGTQHHWEVLNLEKACALLPQITRDLDEPQGDPSLLPTWLLSRFTRQHVTVALGGDGGDELFAGYDPFQALHPAVLYRQWVPGPMHEAIRQLSRFLPVSHRNLSWDFKIKRTLRGLSQAPSGWLPAWMGALEPRELDHLFGNRLPPEELYSEAIEAWESAKNANPVDRATQFFVRLYLQDGILAKVDRASMLNSLEARSPFLDIDFVNFARRIPAQFKLRNGTTKYLLKKALEPVLPNEIIYRKKKGFGVPIGAWFRSGQLQIKDSSPVAQARQKSHFQGRSDERQFLWCQWIYEQWREANGIT